MTTSAPNQTAKRQEIQEKSFNQNVATGIIRGITDFWRCEELHDFTVEVGSVHFGCHRLLLAACSEFFRGLFRSGMQETEQKKVTLKDISSETFELIMESMYTGHDVLTNDNVSDIWCASQQLQIHFLISECENFVLNTLSVENYAEYFYTSTLLNSAVILERLWPLVLKKCNSFFKTEYFLELPLAVVLSLIKSQDLKTKSEDDVIRAILKWLEFQGSHISDVTIDGNTYSCEQNNDEEREISDGDISCSKKCTNGQDISTVCNKVDRNIKMDHITILLSHSRTCLASRRCLNMLIRHPLVKDNQEAKDIVIDALRYQLQGGKKNGHWPSRAVHRNNSRFIHCIVTAISIKNSGAIIAYSIARDNWYVIKEFENWKTIKLAIVNNKVYSLYNYGRTKNFLPSSSVYFLRASIDKNTDVETALPLTSDDFCVAVVDSFVYIFLAQEQTVWELDVNSREIHQKSRLPFHENIAYVMAYGHSILVFYALTGEGVRETVVQCFDTVQNTWTVISHLEGKADGMTSFEDDHFTYLLLSNGSLWKLVKPQSNIIDFEHVARFWRSDVSLHGAVSYLGDLHIGIHPNEDLRNDRQLLRSLPGVFKEIIYHVILSDKTSVFAPILLNQKDYYRDELLPHYKLSENISTL